MYLPLNPLYLFHIYIKSSSINIIAKMRAHQLMFEGLQRRPFKAEEKVENILACRQETTQRLSTKEHPPDNKEEERKHRWREGNICLTEKVSSKMWKGKRCQIEVIPAFPRCLDERMKRQKREVRKTGMTESGFLWRFPEHLFRNFTVGCK